MRRRERTLFVTGATGFIGGRFLDMMPGPSGWERVICLSRASQASPFRQPAVKIEFVRGDLHDTAAYEPHLRHCSTVVHLAAQTGKTSRAEHFHINRDGTQALLGASERAGVERFLHVSTITATFRRKSAYDYACAKEAAEEIVRHGGLAHIIVRPTIVLGQASRLLFSLARLATAPVAVLFGGGRKRVQPVDVIDVGSALHDLLAESDFRGQEYDLGGPDVVMWRELFRRMHRLVRGREPRFVHVPLIPTLAGLRLVERLAPGLLPIRAGQLCNFLNDGIAAPSRWLAERTVGMRTLDDMIAPLAAGPHGL